MRMFFSESKRAIRSKWFYITMCAGLCQLIRGFFELVGYPNSYSYTNLEVISISLGFGLYIYLCPVFCAIPYAHSFSDDFNFRTIIYKMTRASRRSYALSKWLANGLAGGISIAFPFLIYCLLIGAVTSPFDMKNPHHLQLFSETIYEGFNMANNGWLFIMMISALMFLFGFIWANVGMCISSYIPSRAVAVMAPFLICYCFMYMSQHLGILWLNPMDLLYPSGYANAFENIGFILWNTIILIFSWMLWNRRIKEVI